MNRLLPLNRLPWYARWPAKSTLLVLTVVLVLFPDPRVLMRQVEHWRDPNALVEPDEPSLAPMVEALAPQMAELEGEPAEALKTVEKYVYEQVPYDWDWNTWGAADYMPTVAETLAKGREDCDGRAVVAASLLAHFGFNARIVTDFAHVWVATDRGETMGPGKRKAVTGTKDGPKVDFQALAQLPSASAYGLAVFPLLREVILLLVAWWLLLRDRGGRAASLAGLLFLVNGLLFLRVGGRNYQSPVLWMQWVGVANVVVGLWAMLVTCAANDRRARASASPVVAGGSSRV